MASLTSMVAVFLVLAIGAVRECTAFQTGQGLSQVPLQLSFEESEPEMSALSMSQSTNTGTAELPPLLQKMADERREYEMNLGKAMDVLRRDYPEMLRKMPDMSIYHEELKVVDPSGVQLTGVDNYKNSFRFLQSLVGIFYDISQSSVQSRMVYDFARSVIRISWHVVLVPKVMGNRRNSVYIDGISIYGMDATSGKITEHRVEQMLINNTPVVPPYGVFSAIMQDFGKGGERVPVGIGGAMISSE